jgi:hypothetical protein
VNVARSPVDYPQRPRLIFNTMVVPTSPLGFRSLPDGNHNPLVYMLNERKGFGYHVEYGHRVPHERLGLVSTWTHLIVGLSRYIAH